MAEINSIPLGARIILRRDKASQHSPGGVILPQESQEPPSKGTILAVGPGEPAFGTWQDVNLSVGDEVLFSPYSGVDIKVEGQEVLVIHVNDCIVKLNPATPEIQTDAQQHQSEAGLSPV